MTGSFLDAWQFSRRYSAHMLSILGRPSLILRYSVVREAGWEEDTRQATDAVVYRSTPGDIRVAMRVCRPPRDAGKLRERTEEFTVRETERDGRTPGELYKLREGWGHALLYALTSQCEQHLAHWVLVDLTVWREHPQVAGLRRQNDGDSFFRKFALADYPPRLVIERWPAVPTQEQLFDLPAAPAHDTSFAHHSRGPRNKVER